MAYDNIDSDSDGVVEADVDNESVITEQAVVGGTDFAAKADRAGDDFAPQSIYDTVYADADDLLNEVVDGAEDADGNAHVVLPHGTITFDDYLPWSNTLIVEGQGETLSTIQVDTYTRLINQYSTNTDSTLVIKDCTIDCNNVDSSTMLLNMQADRGTVRLENVTLTNVDFSSVSSTEGILFVDSNLDELVIDECTFIFDVDSHPDAVCKVVHQPSGNVVSTARITNTDFYGTIGGDTDERDAGGYAFLQGFKFQTDRSATISGCHFENIDQYATFICCEDPEASVNIHNNSLKYTGGGDILRAGSDVQGGTVKVTDNTQSAISPNLEGDRIIVIQGASDGYPDKLLISDNVIDESLTPIDVQQGHNITISDNIIKDAGFPNSDDSGSRAIMIANRDSDIVDISCHGNHIFSEAGRDMDVGIRYRHRVDTGAGTWRGHAIIKNNFIKGYNTAPYEFHQLTHTDADVIRVAQDNVDESTTDTES